MISSSHGEQNTLDIRDSHSSEIDNRTVRVGATRILGTRCLFLKLSCLNPVDYSVDPGKKFSRRRLDSVPIHCFEMG